MGVLKRKKKADVKEGVGVAEAESSKPKKKKSKKNREATGSRWAAVVLLLATVIASLYFYLANNQVKIESRGAPTFNPLGGETRFELK